MNAIKRPKISNVKIDKPKFDALLQVKVAFFFLFVLLGFLVYLNWHTLLEKLDTKPVSAYALMNKTEFTQNEDILDVLRKVEIQQGFWSLDVDSVQSYIQSIPWIEKAIVRKSWPNRLSVWVDEYHPVAIWNKNNLVTKNGEIFVLPLERLKGQSLPLLGGPDYQAKTVLQAWNQIYNDFKAKNLIIKGVEIDSRGAWQVTLDNGIVLKLGRDEWKPKLERFVTIYPQIEVPDNKKIDYVDLRYPSGAAVKLADK